mgnify:CR=1 FL=1
MEDLLFEHEIDDKLQDSTSSNQCFPKTTYMIGPDGFVINVPVPQYSGNFFKQYTIPKYAFDMAIKTYLPDLIKNDPDIRNMISDIVRKEIRKTR